MLRKCRIQVEGFGELRVDPGRLFLEALNRAGIDLHNDCGGQGSCGKCRMIFLTDPPEPLAGDRRHLNDELLSQGVRLACFHQIRGDCAIVIPPAPEPELLDDLV
jgi:Na+-transporting NADH:ubiquinone oxidoreductase subunit NqrF